MVKSLCPDYNFTINGWILKLLCTNVDIDETECRTKKSFRYLKGCGQSLRPKVKNGEITNNIFYAGSTVVPFGQHIPSFKTYSANNSLCFTKLL